MHKGGGHARRQLEEVMKDLVSHARDWAIEKHGNQTYAQGEGGSPVSAQSLSGLACRYQQSR